MTPVLTILDEHIDEAFLKHVAKQLHADRQSVRQAFLAGVPIVIGVLAHNAASSGEQAQQLYEALDKDHPGGLLESLPRELKSKGGLKGALFGSVGTMTGGGHGRSIAGLEIINHILDGRKAAVAKGVSSVSHLAPEKTEELLEFLAPVVMSALGRVRREQDLDAQGVRALLIREREMIEEAEDELGDEALWAFLNYESSEEVTAHVEETARALSGSGMMQALFND